MTKPRVAILSPGASDEDVAAFVDYLRNEPDEEPLEPEPEEPDEG